MNTEQVTEHADVVEGYRLSPQQTRLWTLRQGDGSLPYRSRCAVLVEGPLDAAALQSAFDAVAARHDILRTTFALLPGTQTPVQVVEEERAHAVRLLDLSGEDAARQRAAVESLFDEEASEAFDLERGPLVRLRLLRLAPERHV